jgi:hypothetical protein
MQYLRKENKKIKKREKKKQTQENILGRTALLQHDGEKSKQ